MLKLYAQCIPELSIKNNSTDMHCTVTFKNLQDFITVYTVQQKQVPPNMSVTGFSITVITVNKCLITFSPFLKFLHLL